MSNARVQHRPGVMNKLEAAYADHLEQQRLAGEIREWAFEPERLILANRCTYCPDFRVIDADGFIAFHEVKGFARDDAMVKLKVAAEMHPYRFYLVRKRPKRDGGGWDIQEVKSRA